LTLTSPKRYAQILSEKARNARCYFKPRAEEKKAANRV